MRRTLFAWTIAFMSGLLLARFSIASPWLYVLLSLGSTALFALLLLCRQPIWLCFLACMLTLGCLYGDWRESLQPTCDLSADEPYTLTGWVTAVTGGDQEKQRFDFRVESVDGVSVAKSYTVRVTADGKETVTYGDELKLKGSILNHSGATNPGEFDYDTYLQNQGILARFSTLYGGTAETLDTGRGWFVVRWAYQLRNRFEMALAYLPQEEQALVTGIFLGDKTGLEDDTRTNLIRAGIMHAFAVSGLHVGYVILFLTALCGLFRIYNWPRLTLISAVLLVYCAMTGFVPSVMRASIMGVLMLAAFNFGRERDGLTALSAAALILMLIEPHVLAQAGFQLSFAAMFGILWFMPFLERLIPWKFPLRGGVLVMLAAQIGVMPLLVYYFHLVSFASLLISVVCCLIVGGIVILVLCAMLPAVLCPAAGAVFLYGAGFLVELVLWITQLSLFLPGAYRYIGTVKIWQILLTYIVLIALPLIPRLRLQRGLGATALIIVLAVFLFPWSSLGQQTLSVTFLDVGSGNCVVVRTPNGQTALIDAGSSSDTAAAYVIAPYLTAHGVNRLSAVVQSHGDEDHSNGIGYLLSFFPCRQLWLSVRDPAEPELIALAKEKEVELIAALPGDTLDLGGGAMMTVLAPAENDDTTSSNELSLVVRLTYGDISFLFPGDIGQTGIDNLLRQQDNVTATVLEIPHHGSVNSFSPYLYREAAPRYAVISVGKNAYGHPDKQVLDYFAARDVPVYRTDQNGAVTFVTDGNSLTVETFLNENTSAAQHTKPGSR